MAETVIIVQAVREAILAAHPGIREGVKWNAPSFYTTEHFATFHLRAKQGVQLILHLGAKPRPDACMQDAIGDAGLPLEWKGQDRAVVTFADLDQAQRDRAALTELIRRWLPHVR